MAAEEVLVDSVSERLNHNSFYLNKFRLYETPSNYYMIGRDKSKLCWRVLKVDRTEPPKLNIVEDPTTYSEKECKDLLNRIDEGNKRVGGLKYVSVCYGIIGFVKFLGPYYMLIITERRKLGTICGHIIYGISKSKMIPIPDSAARSNFPYSKDENRYKKLLCTVDLTKDFYFSYSYHVMRCLQKNVADYKGGQFVYETMFVWNEYLTRGIRDTVKNTLWTVALVYGFFKQVDLSVSGRDFNFTLIARRSRHYAGTRYLKRGVNDKGRVANDVETEQIVIENATPGSPMQISSVVQIRGSIPLFWSQDTSRIIVKPDITLSRKDHNYEATRLHFENLVKRYGDPIIILNLIKMREKKPRETILRAEFANAIRCINRSLKKENKLTFLQWDLHKHSRSKATSVLEQLGNMAAYSLKQTGIFHCHVNANLKALEYSEVPVFEQKDYDDCISDHISSHNGSSDSMEIENRNGCFGGHAIVDYTYEPVTLQRGVLRTNCIDCLDRTNVAQYTFGLVALGSQLHALEFTQSPKMDLNDSLSNELMKLYETMGDVLALQYGGSAAHNKIFSETRGQWKPATQSQELIRTVQRYYNNAYLDRDKQDAINVFLGHFQPQLGKAALWELDSDYQYKLMRRDATFPEEDVRSCKCRFMKRSLSDGNISSENDTPITDKEQRIKDALSDSAPEIPASESTSTRCRYKPSLSQKQFLKLIQEEQTSESDHITCDDNEESNFMNLADCNWLSSTANSCENEANEGSRNGDETDFGKTTPVPVLAGFSEGFVKWVCDGGLLF